MTDDALSAFVDAYRAEHSARSLDRRALRARVVAAAGRRRVRRLERLRLLLPLAATFAGSVALAASPPVRGHLRDAFSFFRGGASARADAPRARPGKGRASPPTAPRAEAVAPARGALEVAPVLSVASLPAEPLPPREAMRTVARAEPPRPVPSVATPVGSEAAQASFDVTEAPVAPVAEVPAAPPADRRAAPSPDLSLYRRAHELHFGGGDHARALTAWDAYLRAFPAGTFAPEARLNRAVCLAKLGRKLEAEGVLVDIERGRFGKDGRRQARKILGALDGDD